MRRMSPNYAATGKTECKPDPSTVILILVIVIYAIFKIGLRTRGKTERLLACFARCFWFWLAQPKRPKKSADFRVKVKVRRSRPCFVDM